ncbi:MAG: rhodanese-like domain-containing protein [Opitutaceae bacterium]|nr:rhodanese-like domain-containing protein [Opitutaceae bacterium]
MNSWYLWVFVGAWFAFFLFRKMRSGISGEKVQALLRQGAVLLDVRGKNEFTEGHLPDAVNLPLNQLSEKAGEIIPNRETAVLCYCLSGTRSGIAVGQLRRMGYANAFNLGSYSHAMKTVKK